MPCTIRTRIAAVSANAFDRNRYPRTYKPWLPLRIAVGLLGALAFAGGANAFAKALLEQMREASLPGLSSCLLDLAVCALAYVSAMSLLRARIALTWKALELRSLWTTTRALRSDILDCELLRRGRAGDGFRLSASTLPRTTTSPMLIHFDDDLKAWFTGLPDSRKVETTRNLEALARDESRGATPGARLAGAEKARSATRLLTRAVLVLACWTCFYPRPRMPLLLLNAACPWIAMWLCWYSKGLFSLAANKNSGRGELFVVHLLPILVLGWRGMEDVMLASWSTLSLWSLIAAIPMAVLLLAACRELRRSSFAKKLLNCALLLLYAASVLALANQAFDDAPGNAQLATVVARRITQTKYTMRYLTLSPTPADMASSTIEVTSDFYRRTRVGGHVCLIEREGALGWHWIQVMAESACPAN